MQKNNINPPIPQPKNTFIPPAPPAASPKPKNISLIILFSAILLILIGDLAFLYYQNQQLRAILANQQAQTTITLAPTPTPVYIPIQPASPSATAKPVANLSKSSLKVSSPYNLTGNIPAGWMFEGVFPIKLLDANRNLIVQTQGKEKVAGTWQSGNPVDFTATLTFTTAAKSGFLVFANDNPSGDPTKSKSFEVPVIFQ